MEFPWIRMVIILQPELHQVGIHPLIESRIELSKSDGARSGPPFNPAASETTLLIQDDVEFIRRPAIDAEFMPTVEEARKSGENRA
jgi:hypothetical protein